MKRLLSLLLCSVFFNDSGFSQKDQISYRFSFDSTTSTLSVQAEMRGTDSGRTYLQLPDKWASQKELYKALQFLTVQTKGATLHTTSDSSLRYILHKPNQKLVLNYALKQDWSGELHYPKNFRAIVQKKYLQLTGYALFILPKKEASETIEVKLDWSDFPKNWSIANSLHADTRKYRGRLMIGDLQNAFYIAGDFRLYKLSVLGRPAYVAVGGNNWKFQDTAFVNKVGTIISMQRNFWNDHSEPYYFVSLIPFDGEGSYNGSALHQSFMLAMSQDFGIDHYLYSLLTHEYFHRWNGISFSLKARASQEDAWFKEGFTEYYTYKLLHRSGIISFTDLIRPLRKMVKGV